MELDNSLIEIKNKILEVEKEITRVGSAEREKQLIKYKHRLEKEVMKYMYFKYGVIMRKEKR